MCWLCLGSHVCETPINFKESKREVVMVPKSDWAGFHSCLFVDGFPACNDTCRNPLTQQFTELMGPGDEIGMNIIIMVHTGCSLTFHTCLTMTCRVLKVFLENGIHSGATHKEHAKYKTFASMYLVYELKYQGHSGSILPVRICNSLSSSTCSVLLIILLGI